MSEQIAIVSYNEKGFWQGDLFLGEERYLYTSRSIIRTMSMPSIT